MFESCQIAVQSFNKTGTMRLLQNDLDPIAVVLLFLRWLNLTIFQKLSNCIAAAIRTNSGKPHHDEAVTTLLSKIKNTNKHKYK